jgi:competence protein ComEA
MKLPILSIALAALLFAACQQTDQSYNAPAQTTLTTQNKPANCINLNQASAVELSALPGIGDVMAQKIIEYRKRHEGFRRPQELIIIEGFSEKKYRALADLVCVE